MIMGWSVGYKPKGESVVDHLVRVGALKWDNPNIKLLDSAVVNMREFYAAVEMVDAASGAKRVIAIVSLLSYGKGGEFGYKMMDESMDPNVANCPARILNLLSPVAEPDAPDGYSHIDGYSLVWRKRCWANIMARNKANNIEKGSKLVYGGNEYEVVGLMRGGRSYIVKNKLGLEFKMSKAKAKDAVRV